MFTDEFIEAFGRDLNEKYESLYRTGDKESLLEIFDKAPKYEVDISGTLQELEVPNDYINNSKIIYDSLRDLKPTQASKESLWFSLANTFYLDYTLKLLSSNDRTKVKNALFMKSKREQLIQCISKYWWLGYLLYDETSEAPYELLEYFCAKEAIGKTIGFFSSKLTSNKQITLGIVEGIKDRKDYIKNSRSSYSFVNEHFNNIGGVKILDLLTREDVYRETIDFIDEIVKDPYKIPPVKRNKVLLRR